MGLLVTTLDTNVVVRVVVKDDEAQEREAQNAWRAALSAGGVFLSKVVLVETAWVLRSAYHFDAATIAATLQRLLSIEGVTAEDEGQVRQALQQFEQGKSRRSMPGGRMPQDSPERPVAAHWLPKNQI